MAFSKTFPKTTEKSVYPKWIEVEISGEEEKGEEQRCREENVSLMKECILDAKKIIKEESLKDYQTDIVNVAVALFEKRASHAVYYKESACKDKFDKLEKQKSL